jgi:hypothetical protein
MPQIPITTNGKPATATLLPPRLDACQVCGRYPAHPPDDPHDAQSLYYQYAFYAEHGCWPTWKDAVAHCPKPIAEAWELELRESGVWPPD